METTDTTREENQETPEQPESKLGRLADELEKTNDLIENTFSYKMIVIRGLLTGVAVVAGSTILASILFSGIRLIFGDIPLPW